jgi:hypothetical protein
MLPGGGRGTVLITSPYMEDCSSKSITGAKAQVAESSDSEITAIRCKFLSSGELCFFVPSKN